LYCLGCREIRVGIEELWRNIWAEKEERAGISEELPTLKLTLSRQRNKIFSIFPPIFSVITEENLARSFFA